MADNIKLTPELLQSQAVEMRALSEAYEELFGGVTKVLGAVNEEWSENLANNFASKIKSAQNSFLKVTGMLTAGADAAKNSAQVFESIDEALAKMFGGTTEGSSTASVHAQAIITDSPVSKDPGYGLGDLWGEIKDSFRKLPEDWKTVGKLIDVYDERYEKLPDMMKESLKNHFTKEEWLAIQNALDIIQGDFGWENAVSITSYMVSGDLTVSSIIKVLEKYGLNKILDLDYSSFNSFSQSFGEQIATPLEQEYSVYTDFITEEFMEGDLLSVAEGMLSTGWHMTNDAIEAIADAGGAVVDGTLNGNIFYGTANKIVEHATGRSAGGWISYGADAMTDCAEYYNENLREGLDVINDMLIDSLKGGWHYWTDAFK